jgi:hypothetical protein
MALKKLKFLPGISRDRSNLASMGGWYDGDKIRFRQGYPEKIGGWTAAIFDQYVGEASKLFVYSTFTGIELAGLATSQKIYIRAGTALYDITPIRATFVSPVTDNCFTTTATSATVTVAITGHEAENGDFVTFSGATAVGGITGDQLNQNFEITYIDANSFSITTTGTATSSVAGGGGTGITATFEINIGPDVAVGGYGWGTDTWGRGTWGSSATTPALISIRLSFMDNFNNDLIFNFSNRGAIYYWDYSLGFSTRAVLLSSLVGSIAVPAETEEIFFAPSGHLLALGCSEYNETRVAGAVISSITRVPGNRVATVTTATSHSLETNDWVTMSGQQPKDFLGTYQIIVTSGTTFTYTMLSAPASDATTVGTYTYDDYSGGAFDPLLIRWADVSADIGPRPEYWKPEIANSAGFLRIQEGSKIVAGINARQETLIWTESTLNTLQFLGTAEVFGVQLLSKSISIMGPNAVVEVNNITYWMGTDNFFQYDGRVNILPCPLLRYVFEDLNRDQSSLVYAGSNKEFNEVIWFYCSEGNLANNRYIIYNYSEKIWYYGQLNRTAWVDSGINQFPLAASEGWIYNHENGTDAGQPLGAAPLAIDAYIESAFVDMEDGEYYILTKRVIPDVDFTASDPAVTPQVTMSIAVTKFPGAATSVSDVEGLPLSRNVVTTAGIISQYTNEVFIRARGRQISFKIASNTVGTQWQLGDTRLDSKADGLRG